ncbi:MAG: Gfo/Idh/MocA family protein [Planctomycetota bacterium]
MSAPLSCGVIGCGSVAPTHVESYRQNENVQVKWACDLIKAKARNLAAEYHIPQISTNYEDVINDSEVDCISVCTEHSAHPAITVAALDSGKHVLCEKALAATSEGMDDMFEAHERNPHLVFSGVFQHRFDAIYRALKQLLNEDALGTILTGGVQVRCLRTDDYYHGDEWRGTWAQEGGSVLINQAIHFIDILLWLMDGAREVCGAHTNLTHRGVIETEDCATGALRFHNGALGTLEATSSSHLNWEPTISIHGTAGSVEIRHAEPIKLLFDDPDAEQYARDTIADAREAGGVTAGKDYYGTGHAAQIADFISAIREQHEPFVPAHEARHAVDVVLKIYESHKNGRWMNC